MLQAQPGTPLLRRCLLAAFTFAACGVLPSRGLFANTITPSKSS
jgi:hypothetical protein